MATSYLARAVPAADSLPDAFSLARFRKYPFNQGQVGSCFANAGAQAFQILTEAENYAGASWDTPQLSRRLVWYQGRKLDGLLGDPHDGGSVTHAIAALALPPTGIGDATEIDWPYRADHAWLEMTPPPVVFDAAKRNCVCSIVNVPNLDDGARSLILNGHPIAIGIWWPIGWDTVGATFMDVIGRGEYGHALCVIGWLKKDGALYWQIENSHGPIYAPLPADLAATVTGYAPAKPNATFDFWVRDAILQKVIGYGQSELVAPVGVQGIMRRDLTYEGMMS